MVHTTGKGYRKEAGYIESQGGCIPTNDFLGPTCAASRSRRRLCVKVRNLPPRRSITLQILASIPPVLCDGPRLC